MSTRHRPQSAPGSTSSPSTQPTKRERRELARIAHEERRRREARKRRARQVAVAVAGLVVLGALGFGVRSLTGSGSSQASATSIARVASMRFLASDGQSFTLEGLRGSKVVLYFYEGQACGACQTQLQQLQAQLPQLERNGATAVAATLDPIGVSTSVAQQLGLSYPILEDRDHVLGSAFGTYVASGHMGSVDQHSVVVLDERGKMVWRQLAGTTMYVAPEDILAAVAQA